MSAARHPAAPLVLGPQVQGRFYPEDPRPALNAAFAGARSDWRAPFKAIIAAHAGLSFSGAVAASAWRSLAHLSSLKRVVILAPAHRMAFSGLAIPPVERIDTAIGALELDAEAAGRALAIPEARLDGRPFEGEHAIEMQALFIARGAAQARVLPVLVGDCPPEAVSDLIGALWGGPETLFVLSSDFSHDLTAAEARQRDLATAAAIERLDAAALRSEDACGLRPILGFLDHARRRDLRPVRLDLRTSGDTANAARIVGYPAFGFVAARDARTPKPLQDELLQCARKAVVFAASRGKAPNVALETFAPPLQGVAATFVTLELDGRLRGCIGAYAPHRPLVADVIANAVKAAIGDPRFQPLNTEEAARVAISIAILSHPRETPARAIGALAQRIEPDRDGLILESGQRRALFLPSVWAQIPEPEQFIAALLRKAGIEGWPRDLRAFRFTTEKIAV
jgi:hypothetical protein